MPRARYQQVSLGETPYYDCICRCVRRAFLCGPDHYSGPLLGQRWLRDETGEVESLKAQEIVEEWRSRLYDLGWFMRCLNEHLARRANEEDGCKGRFWEGRYKSQALLDEKALLSCMAYVDLNPVRAGMAATPEASDYTSLQQRSRAVQNKFPIEKVPTLLPLVDAEHIESDDNTTICRMRLMDYLELVDSTGRALRSDKRGAIDGSAAGILDRLGVDQTVWLEHMAPRKQRAPLAIGPLVKVRAFAEATGRRWIAGQNVACALG